MTIIKKSKHYGLMYCDKPKCKNKDIIIRENDKWIYPEDWLELYLYGLLKNLCPNCCDLMVFELNGKKKSNNKN
ncbi:MAG: hypothetical protein LN408_03265 [Candidatus Thermoplasmatota archaeon]|nr:hypothetical protein [Candidatus Thermoplasmatota archaeon]